MLPNSKLLDVLEPAFAPCPGFSNTCAQMTWNPRAGHVPRGFVGAVGALEDVQLVLVFAEPGDPHDRESYPEGASPREILEKACTYAYNAFVSGKDLFHRNVGYILDACWPSLSLEAQLRHVWLTESVLCSASVECGRVPAATTRACRVRYLEAQLELLPNATVAALGGKAKERLRGWPKVKAASSVAPPGCNFRNARRSWNDVISAVRG